MTELEHQLDPDQFATIRDQNRNAAADKDVCELSREIASAIENDPVRTTQGAIALGKAFELMDRLHGA